MGAFNFHSWIAIAMPHTISSAIRADALPTTAEPLALHRDLLADANWGSLTPASVPKDLRGGEVLSAPRDLEPDQPASALKAEVASALARCLMERHEWERPVAIDSKAVDRLLASPFLTGKSQLQWELQTDANARQVLLTVRSGGRVMDAAPILDLGQVPAGMVVMRLDEDDSMARGEAALMNRFNPGGRAEGGLGLPAHLSGHMAASRPLAGLPAHMRLGLLAHSSVADKTSRDQRHSVAQVGFRTPAQMADWLKQQGLEKSFAGTIYLITCSAGSDPGHAQGSYAQQLHAELAQRGYRHATVAGLPGNSVTDADGHLWTSPSRLVQDQASELQKSDRRTYVLTKQLVREKTDLHRLPRNSPDHGAQQARVEGLQQRIHGEARHARTLEISGDLKRQYPFTSAENFHKFSREVLKLTAERDAWGHLGPSAPVEARNPASGPAKGRARSVGRAVWRALTSVGRK